MITFEKIALKEWKAKSNEKEIDIALIPSSITNKFHIITTFVENVSKVCGEEFDNWFIDFLESIEEEETKANIIQNNLQKVKDYVDKYLAHTNIDFSQFVDETKAKKNSVLFLEDELSKIIHLSCYLKIYSFIFNNPKLKVGQKLHSYIYNFLASDISETDIVHKIYTIVSTKTFRFNVSDRYMWDYINTVQCKDIGVHIIEIFNFIMNYILVLCEEDRNPVFYFIGVIDESVKWFLRSVYKGSIIYDDSISTEDIQGINTDNLKTYAYNDTMGRLKGIALDKISEILERRNILKIGENERDLSDKDIVEFHERLSQIEFISPITETLIFPILSRCTQIPYEHFATLNAEHSAILSVYTKELLSQVFKNEFKNLFNLLEYYPKDSPCVATTYKIKAIHDFVNCQDLEQNFFGFNTKIFSHKVLCYFIGRVSRISFYNILTGQTLGGIPLSKVEQDMIYFYTHYFANNFEPQIEKITKLINKDF